MAVVNSGFIFFLSLVSKLSFTGNRKNYFKLMCEDPGNKCLHPNCVVDRCRSDAIYHYPALLIRAGKVGQ